MSFIDPVMNPLLQLNPFLSLIIITVFVSLFVTIVYKYTTNQKRMKELREEAKKYQQEMKDAKNDSQRMLQIQKKAMASNLETMKHSFKSTLYTFIPLILLLAWLNGHFAYHPIMPGEEFSITTTFKEGTLGEVSLQAPELQVLSPQTQNISSGGTATWKLKGKEGPSIVTILYRDESYKQTILITAQKAYEIPLQKVSDSKLQQINTDLAPMKPIDPYTLFGWRPGWFITYIVLSLIFTTLFRKILGVY